MGHSQTGNQLAVLTSRFTFAFALVLVLAACGAPDKSKRDQSSQAPFVPPTRAASTTGFQRPIAAIYDSATDLFFIANLGADSGTAAARGAFISRMRPDGSIDSLRFIANGRDDVRLDAPHGMALVGDTLWVVDRDFLRAFDARTGMPGPTISVAPLHAVALAALAAGPDGTLYATDIGTREERPVPVPPGHPDHIFRITPDHAVSVALVSDSLQHPSGIIWDARSKRFVIVSSGGSSIFSWRPGDVQPHRIGYNSGLMQGVAILPDGRMLVTSWRDSSLTIRDADKLIVIRGFPTPGYVSVDTRRNRVAVPVPARNRVDIWAIPPITR